MSRKFLLAAFLFALVTTSAAARQFSKFGVADSVSVDGTVIWSGHAILSSNLFPASPGALTAVSSSAADSSGGGGTESLSISGIFAPGCDTAAAIDKTVTVTLTGATPVDPDPGAADCWFRVHRAFAHAGGDNVGLIEVKIDGVTVAAITAGVGQTEQAAFGTTDTVRIQGITVQLLANSGPGASMIVKLFSREWGGPRRVRILPLVIANDVPSAGVTVGSDVAVGPGHDVWIEAYDVVSGSGTVAAQIIYDIHK